MYGITELHREDIRPARLVANPGCYPTYVQLPLVPLLQVPPRPPARAPACDVSGLKSVQVLLELLFEARLPAQNWCHTRPLPH